MLQTIVPKSPLLQKYIDAYYLFSGLHKGSLNYVAFPHTNTGLSFFKGVCITRENFQITVKESNPNDYCIELLGKYTRPVFVTFEGCFDEVAVIFKPLGVNRFIGADLARVAPYYSQPFYDEQWTNIAAQLFTAIDPIDTLEVFLLSVFSERQDLENIASACALFDDNTRDYSVAEVAEELAMNIKTFQRNFTKTLACSPSDYKRITRFRNALKSRLFSKEFKSLTNISYENNYADQSYFIREFRKLANQNPKEFFKEVILVDGDKIVWEIL